MAEASNEDVLKKCLQQLYSGIVESFDPKGYILNSLFGTNTITLDEKRRIAGLPAGERGAELIDRLLVSQRPNAITQFLEILSHDDMTSCKWISDKVHKAAQERVASTFPSSLETGESSVPINQYSGALQPEQSVEGKCSFCKYANM